MCYQKRLAATLLLVISWPLRHGTPEKSQNHIHLVLRCLWGTATSLGNIWFPLFRNYKVSPLRKYVWTSSSLAKSSPGLDSLSLWSFRKLSRAGGGLSGTLPRPLTVVTKSSESSLMAIPNFSGYSLRLGCIGLHNIPIYHKPGPNTIWWVQFFWSWWNWAWLQ